MNEDDLAKRIVDRLDRQLDELPAHTVSRLAEVRRNALRASAARVSVLSGLRENIGARPLFVRMAMPALVLLATVGMVFYLQLDGQDKAMEVDAALLAVLAAAALAWLIPIPKRAPGVRTHIPVGSDDAESGVSTAESELAGR